MKRGLNTEDRGRRPRGFSPVAAADELIRTFGVTEDPDGEVLDVGGPLCRQLEKFDVVPLHAVDSYCGAGNTVKHHRSATPFRFRGLWRTSQHGLLLLGSADEAADALDHLALGLHLLVFALFWQEHDWRRTNGRHMCSGSTRKVKAVKPAAIKAPAVSHQGYFTLLVLLLGHHSHGHAGLGAQLCAP